MPPTNVSWNFARNPNIWSDFWSDMWKKWPPSSSRRSRREQISLICSGRRTRAKQIGKNLRKENLANSDMASSQTNEMSTIKIFFALAFAFDLEMPDL